MNSIIVKRCLDLLITKCETTGVFVTDNTRAMWTDLISPWRDEPGEEAVRTLVFERTGKPDPAALVEIYRTTSGSQLVPAHFREPSLTFAEIESTPMPEDVREQFRKLKAKIIEEARGPSEEDLLAEILGHRRMKGLPEVIEPPEVKA